MELRISAPMVSKAEIAGSGSIRFTTDAKIDDSLDAVISGSGNIQMGGLTCNNLKSEVSGSGNIQMKSVSCKNLETKISGSGDLSVNNVKADNVEANITGSGKIKLTGNAVSANYQIIGSGNIHADNLMTKGVKAEIIGSGDIFCYAIETLNANHSGSGDVHYKGNPQISTNKKNWLHHIQ